MKYIIIILIVMLSIIVGCSDKIPECHYTIWPPDDTNCQMYYNLEQNLTTNSSPEFIPISVTVTLDENKEYNIRTINITKLDELETFFLTQRDELCGETITCNKPKNYTTIFKIYYNCQKDNIKTNDTNIKCEWNL